VTTLLFLLAVAALCVALARPHLSNVATSEHATVVLVIDASRSMQSDDVRPTRLEAAKAAAHAFLERVPKRLRVGLVVFAGDAQVAASPTTDRPLVRASIDAIGTYTGFGGTAIGDAIVRAVELGLQAVAQRTLAAVGAAPERPSADALVSILFLSDGRQNRGIVPPLEGAARARAAGIPVFTVALGSADGAGSSAQGGFGYSVYRAPDPETLRAIAEMTGGEFFEERSAESLKASYAELGSRLGRAPSRREITFAFLLAAAGLVLALGAVTAVWSPRLP
jgi:Ca-activated chloride channel family protein